MRHPVILAILIPLAGLPCAEVARTEPPSPDTIFSRADADRNVLLSLDEIRSDLDAHRPPAPSGAKPPADFAEKLEKAFAKADANHDGALTKEEFRSFLAALPKPPKTPDAQAGRQP